MLLWTDSLVDPKVQALRPPLYKFWVNCLLLARVIDRGGTIPTCAELAVTLHLSEDDALRATTALESATLLDRAPDGSLRIHNYVARQDPEYGLRAARNGAGLRANRGAPRNSAPRDYRERELTSPPRQHPATLRSTPLYNRADPVVALFEQFYARYPRKQDRKRALETWRKVGPDEKLTRKIIAAVIAQQAAEHWDDGYWPLPATYLSGERWLDTPDVSARERGTTHARPGRPGRGHQDAVAGPPGDSWDDSTAPADPAPLRPVR